jgi:hypothetical protein
MDYEQRFEELFEMARTDAYSQPAVEGLAAFVRDPDCPEALAYQAKGLIESQLITANSEENLAHFYAATGG